VVSMRASLLTKSGRGGAAYLEVVLGILLIPEQQLSDVLDQESGQLSPAGRPVDQAQRQHETQSAGDSFLLRLPDFLWFAVHHPRLDLPPFPALCVPSRHRLRIVVPR
jgi:hypothetical protein